MGDGDHLKRLAEKGRTMKTETLKAMGLTQEQIDQIMAENGKDIAAEQAKFSAKEAELTTANQTIKSLQDAAKKFEGTDPEKLKQDLADLQKKYDTDMADTKRNSALDMALMQANVHDVKAARALLNLDEVKLDGEKLLGLDSQLEGLKKDKAWLFAAAEPPKPPTYNPPSGGNPQEVIQSTRDALAAYYSQNQ